MKKQGWWVSLVERGPYDQEGTYGDLWVLAVFYFLTQVVATWW